MTQNLPLIDYIVLAMAREGIAAGRKPPLKLVGRAMGGLSDSRAGEVIRRLERQGLIPKRPPPTKAKKQRLNREGVRDFRRRKKSLTAAE